MITTDDIMSSIKSALSQQFPGEPVYENRTPQKFKRPSNLVELLGIRLGGIKPGAVTLLYTYRITDFTPVDGYHNSDMALLDTRTMAVVGWVFGAGYLKVGDRALKVVSVQTEHNFDFTETTAVLSVTFDRNEFEPSQTLPLMEQLKLSYKEATV